MIKLENVGKIYSTDNNVAVGIRKINLELRRGEFVAITGESGSGKSTLLNIISGIDSYEEGEMYICGEETSYFGVDELENYRNKYVGFIFQNYNIIDSYTVLENVESALVFSNVSEKERKKKAIELIERVGLKKQLKKKAAKLSGGEKQRVVIARALAKDPFIIAADEPTGNLDSKSSKEIIDLIHEVSKDKLVLMVTHDFEEVSEYATRIIRVFDGEIKEDRILKESEKTDFPYLLEDENKKSIKFKDNLKLAVNDLFSSPKRLIFHTFVFFVLTLIVAFSVGLYRNVVRESNMGSGWSDYSNSDPSRIVINKKDGTPFSQSELDALKNDSNVYEVIPDDVLVDSSIGGSVRLDEISYLYVNFYMMPQSFMKKSVLDAGREPILDDEIVIPVTEDQMKNSDVDSLATLTGKSITVWENYEQKTYTVVGCYIGEDADNQYAYITDSRYETMKENAKLSYLECSVTSVIGDETAITIMNASNIMPLSSLNDNEIIFKGANGLVSVKVTSVYGTVFSLENLETKESDFNGDYGVIYISENNYNEYQNSIKNIYQASVFVNNEFKIDSFAKSLNKNGYNYVIPSEIKGIDIAGAMDAIVGGFLFIGIGLFLVETFFIVFVILLHSMIARRGDMEILRTIGASKKVVKNMFTFEFLIQGVVSFVLVVILDIVLLFTAKPKVVMTLKAVNGVSFMIILFVIILMMYLLSLLYSKIVFKNTVKKSLDKR